MDLRLDGDGALVGRGIDHGEGDFSHAERLASVGAGKDDVLHVGAAKRFRALFTEDPAHRVQDVGLAATVWPHHHGETCSGDREVSAVAEAFEAEDVDPFKFQHAVSVGGSKVVAPWFAHGTRSCDRGEPALFDDCP